MLSRWLLLAGLGCLIGHTGLSAQGVAIAPTFDIGGFVLEAGSDRAVQGALIRVPDLGVQVVSDSSGVFVLRDVEPRPYEIEVSVMGYADLSQEVALTPDGVLDIRLLPQPAVLEGLTVAVNRLESRIRAVPYLIRVAEGAELQVTGARNAAEFLTHNMRAVPTPCGVRVIGYPNCLLVRGRARPFRLYVDENPMPAGLEWLDTYRVHELERIEFIPQLGQVRLYTKGYIERLAERGRTLEPICIVCVPG